MQLCLKVLRSLFIVGILFISITAWCSTRILDGAPGTIGACLTQPDGTTVTLPAEQGMRVDRSGKSFGIKEWFEKQPMRPRLVVVSNQPLSVKECWTVDVTGVLGTVPSTPSEGTTETQRILIVSPESVTVYCDPRGKPIMFLPIKGQSTEWTNKRTLAQLSVSSVAKGGSMSTMDEEFPPMPDESYSPTPPAVGSRDSLKWLPDDAPVSLNGVIISAAYSHFFYAEKTDRSFGIRISSTGYEYPNYLVNISGTMTTINGERAINADQVNYDEQFILYPRAIPFGLPNKTVGGGAVGSYTPAVADAVGMNNTGLLVKTWGKVTFADAVNGLFYLDDGSGITSDNGHVGIKVYNTSGDTIPTQDTNYVVTGISGAEIPAGSTSSIRVIYNVWDEDSALLPGTGTVTGTITALGANGKTVHVCSAYSSTTATFSGNTASYTLAVHAGDGAITASMIGYQTTTQLVSVSNGQTVTKNFTLAAIEKIIEVTPAQGSRLME